MQDENNLLEFLQEMLELRAESIGTAANHQEEFIKASQAILDLVASIEDSNIKTVLFQYEELKNHYNSLLMPYMYKKGFKDCTTMLLLILKQFLLRC
ncbi:MAG: hypothetical protein FWG87_11890 [Defluviitaleaceae bacterium]|nr:hypothetical protein [Defluviitaleaceae bacterium]